MEDVIEIELPELPPMAPLPEPKAMDVRNIKVISEDRYDCEILHPVFGWIPFTADINDIEQSTKDVFKHIKEKKIKVAKLPVSESVSVNAIADARAWRDEELNRADVMFNRVTDGLEGKGTVEDWKAYRNALRNWPEVEGFPASASKPVAPDA